MEQWEWTRLWEAQSDALLAAAGRDPEYPAYREDILLRKMQRSRLCDLQQAAQEGLGASGLLESLLRDLKRREIEHMFLSARLTARERHVCRGIARGETCQEIADQCVNSPQAVHSALCRARVKLAATWKLSAYHGLWRLYAEDVHKTIIVKH